MKKLILTLTAPFFLLFSITNSAYGTEAPEVIKPEDERVTAVSKSIVDYAISKKGIKVGNGQCWTLVDHAFKNLRLTRFDIREWGPKVDWRNETILPGDLVEFEKTRFSDGVRIPTVHSAIVYQVKGKKIAVYHQNWNRKKHVTMAVLDLNKIKSGKVIIYRATANQQLR